MVKKRLIVLLLACFSFIPHDAIGMEENNTYAETAQKFKKVDGQHRQPTDNDTRELPLASGPFTPKRGLSKDTIKRITKDMKKEGWDNTVVVALQIIGPPDENFWTQASQRKVVFLSYITDSTWFIRVNIPKKQAKPKKVKWYLNKLRNKLQGIAMFDLPINSKYSSELVEIKKSDKKEVSIEILFFQGTTEPTINVLLSDMKFQQDAVGMYSAKIPSSLISEQVIALSRHQDMHYILMKTEELPLMAKAREKVDVDRPELDFSWHMINTSPVPPDYSGWTGNNVRITTYIEGFDQDHDDFWDHDNTGTRTSGRWLCTHGSSYIHHGTMTAGIIMGNGWNSLQEGYNEYENRGIAPESTFDCSSADPDVESASFTQSNAYSSTYIDTNIWNNALSNHHVYVGSAGNEGLKPQYGPHQGYYSLHRVQKNEIIVQNMAGNDLRWLGGSCGPTWDGRIKPDIAAVGGHNGWPLDVERVSIDVDEVVINTSAGIKNYSMNSIGAGFAQGWGANNFRTRVNMFAGVQMNELSRTFGRWEVTYPWGSAWAGAPKFGTKTEDDGTTPLNIIGTSSDTFIFTYRMYEEYFNDVDFHVLWCPDPAIWDPCESMKFKVYADGQWRTETIPVGTHPGWVSMPSIGLVTIAVGGDINPAPAANCNGCYRGSGGTSASGPVVAGAAALLTQQFLDLFSVDLNNQLDGSPFRQDVPQAGGVVMPSTFRALIAHTALDLASVHFFSEPSNPDTGEPTYYHKGPDYVTGYGLLQAGKALELVEHEHALKINFPAAPYHCIVEDTITSLAGKVYQFNIDAQERHLTVTLAWDDPPPSSVTSSITPKLVNQLDLVVRSPSGQYFFPWSLDLPYIPTSSTGPGTVNPQPITSASIHPARHDIANLRDNLEKVDVEFPESGTWYAIVAGIGLNIPPQRISLILGNPPETSDRLDDGIVVFMSDRVTPAQLFLKKVGSADAPFQITNNGHQGTHVINNPSHPQLSYNGKFVVLLEHDLNGIPDTLVIIDLVGNVHKRYNAFATFGTTTINYPEWSRNGDTIAVNAYDSWGARSLQLLSFDSPYDFSIASASVLVPLGIIPSDPNPASHVFSKDGMKIYFSASSNSYRGAIFQIRVDGTAMMRVTGNGKAIREAFNPSLDTDGRHLLLNSEEYHHDPVTYIDEELLKLDLKGGGLFQETKESGNQYARYAINGKGEYLLRSSAPNGNYDLYLVHGDVRVPLDIDDPSNLSNDNSGDWYRYGEEGPTPYVWLRNADTDQSLYNYASGVFHWGYWPDPGMVYILEPVPSTNLVLLRNVKTNQCIKASTTNGGISQSSVCSFSDINQNFELVDVGDGTVRLKSGSNQCLYTGSGNGGQVHSWGCWNGSGFRFEVLPVF